MTSISNAERARLVERERYAASVGHDGVTRFPEDLDWEYRGTKAEREELGERFGLGDDEPVGYIAEQEELFV